MKALKENLELRLAEMKYGEIQAIPMIDRGSYREPDETDSPQSNSSELTSIAEKLLNADEDFISVQRANQDIALNQTDFAHYMEKLKTSAKPKHLILVNCIDLGTSEIRAFLLELLDKKELQKSKVFLLDLPQIEYLTIRDSLAGKIKM
jgi:hypothetical protein